ncbi:MAG: hypothetical protein AAF658_03985, partial [Myxococcota bacterium]
CSIPVIWSSPSSGNTVGSLIGHVALSGDASDVLIRDIESATQIRLDEPEGGSWSGGLIGTVVVRDAPNATIAADDVTISGTLESTASFNANGALGGLVGLIAINRSENASISIDRVGSTVDIGILANEETSNGALGGLVGQLVVDERPVAISVRRSFADTVFTSVNENRLSGAGGLLGRMGMQTSSSQLLVDTCYVRADEALPEDLVESRPLVGIAPDGAVSFHDGYVQAAPRLVAGWNRSAAGITVPIGVTLLDSEKILDPEAFLGLGWDFSETWVAAEGLPPRLR